MSMFGSEPSRGEQGSAAHGWDETVGLLTWHFDSQGRMTAKPVAAEPAARWLQSSSMQRVLASNVGNWLGGAETAPHELFAGCRLVPVSWTNAGGETELVVIMIMEAGALESPRFETICEEHEVDPAGMRAAMHRCVLTPDSYARQVSMLLGRANAERASAAQRHAAAGDLAKQLAEAYEQISFLYRLTREMTALDSPKQFVTALCKQLHHLLAYRWIAVRYVPSRLAIQGLEREVIVEGELPFPAPMFSELSSHLIEAWQADDWTHVLEPDSNAIASLAGSQIVVEEVTYDDCVIGALLAGNKEGEDTDWSTADSQLLDAAAGILGAFHQNVIRYEELRSLFMGSVRALTATVDAKDPYTRGHSDRVAHLARQLALAAKLGEEEAERVFLAGVVHDVGKIGVPEAILRKPGKLSDEEFDHIKAHPVTGFNILKDIPQMADLLPGVLHHHERWDGKGYPRGLAGEEIPLMARLLALPDSFDAMSSNRAYRPALPREKVLEEIRNCAGTQFDPKLASRFVTLDFSEYDAMVGDHRHQDAYAA